MLAGAEQAGTELSGGDFVRWARQLIDLLDQLAKVAEEPVAGGGPRGGRPGPPRRRRGRRRRLTGDSLHPAGTCA